MSKYIVRRLLQMIPVILGSTFLIYALVFALPGNPVEGRCGERPCSAAYVAKFNADYNLDKPLLVQYVLYIGKLVRGDLGTNFYGKSVLHELAIRFPTTAKLAVIAVVFEIMIGIAAGVLAGIRKSGFFDNLVLVSTLVVISIPTFVIGGVLQLTLGVRLKWFPVTSTNGTLYELIMPGLVLGATSIAYVSRLTRATLTENLRSDYVRTAKAKGLPGAQVILRHAFRTALIPVITVATISFATVIEGAVITETVFGWRGMGRMFIEGLTEVDPYPVMAFLLVVSVSIVLMNAIADVLYAVLDPRIRQ